MKINAKRPFSSSISSQHDYYRNVVERITVRSKQPKKKNSPGNSCKANRGTRLVWYRHQWSC